MAEEDKAKEKEKKERKEEAKEKKGGKKKKEKGKKASKKIFNLPPYLFWAGAVSLILIGAYLTADKIASPLLSNTLLKSKKGVTQPASSIKTGEIGIIYPLEPLIVNLDEERATRYLKISLSLEVDNQEVVNELNTLKPRLIDSLITLLSNKKFTEIQSIEDKKKIRREIIAEFNKRLIKGRVINVYFSEFIIQ